MKIPILRFNYTRNLPPVHASGIPLIVKPLRLERHTFEHLSANDVSGIPFTVAKHKHLITGGFIYIHRINNPVRIGK